MRLATMMTPRGLRLHIRGAGGYVDVADATGDPGLAALGPVLTAGAAALVKLLAEHGAAVLIVEQRARAVLAVSERTYVLGGGEVRMEGTPAELAASPAFVTSFLGGHRVRARPDAGQALPSGG